MLNGLTQIEVRTSLDFSPADITLNGWGECNLNVGDYFSVEIGGKNIIAIVREISKSFSSSQPYYRIQLSDEPANWDIEYSLDVYSPAGVRLSEIIELLNSIVSPWSINCPDCGILIREWSRKGTIIDILSELADMLGLVPILDHVNKNILFLNVSEFPKIEVDDVDDPNIYEFQLNDSLEGKAGIVIKGIYNEPFYLESSFLNINLPGRFWNVQLIDAIDADIGGTVFEISASATITDAEGEWKQIDSVIVNAPASFYICKGYIGEPNFTSWNIENYSNGSTPNGEVFVKISSDNLHEIEISVHKILHASNIFRDAASFQLEVENFTRQFLSNLNIFISGTKNMTGRYFEIAVGNQPYDEKTYYTIPNEECAIRLLEKLWWFNVARKTVSCQLANNAILAGELFQYGGIVSNSRIIWDIESNETISEIEVIG